MAGGYVELDPGSDGAKIATDPVTNGSVTREYQHIQIVLGAAGLSKTPVDGANPFPVSVVGSVAGPVTITGSVAISGDVSVKPAATGFLVSQAGAPWLVTSAPAAGSVWQVGDNGGSLTVDTG